MATVTASGTRRFKLSKFILSWYGILIVYAIMVGIFLLLRLGYGNKPIALSLGSLTFRWYGIIITCGVIVASFLAQFLAERRGDDPDHVWRILPVLLIFGIVFARIWYVFNTWEGYKDYFFSIGNPAHAGAVEIWRGGIAIQGAVVGGILGTILYGYIYNLQQNRRESSRRFNVWRFSDFVAPGLVLAQGIGRWGNFMNNEAYGRETKFPWGIKIPCDYRTSGITPGTDDTLCPDSILPIGGVKMNGIEKDALFHPTFFYESVWNYFTFLVLFFCIMRPKTIERRFKVKLRNGDIFLLYWVVYSIGRFFTEGLRTDSLYFMGNVNSLRTAQVLAIVSILVAGFLLFYRHSKSFPTSEALSMRLAPVLVGVPAGVGVPADAPTTIAQKPVTTMATATEEAAPVVELDADDLDDEIDEPEGRLVEPVEQELPVETEEAPVSGSVIEPVEVEVTPVTPVQTAVVETDGENSSRLGDLDAHMDLRPAEVEAGEIPVSASTTEPEVPFSENITASETSAQPFVVEQEPVSGVIEKVTAPDTLAEATPAAESDTVEELPPPAVDTDPKPVDGVFEEAAATDTAVEQIAPTETAIQQVTPTNDVVVAPVKPSEAIVNKAKFAKKPRRKQ